jgi:hypothetical protein
LGPGKSPVALKTGQYAVQIEHLMQLSILGFIIIFTAETAERGIYNNEKDLFNVLVIPSLFFAPRVLCILCDLCG